LTEPPKPKPRLLRKNFIPHNSNGKGYGADVPRKAASPSRSARRSCPCEAPKNKATHSLSMEIALQRNPGMSYEAARPHAPV
jgi:hypothetical protein